MNRTP